MIIAKFTKNFMQMETAGLDGFFKMIFYIILFYYVFKIAAKLLLPLLVKKVVQKAEQNFKQQYQNQHSNQRDEVIIDTKKSSSTKSKHNVGEYIDYEEIK